MTHNCKTHPQFFNEWISRNKSFEIRRDDRNPRYKVGDNIHQREYNPSTGEYTGRIGAGRIVYILRGFAGLAPGFCAIECPFDHMVVNHSKTDQQIAAELNDLE